MNVLYEQGLESVAGELSQMGSSMHPLRAAVRACVKPRFIDMNLAAIDAALAPAQRS